MQMQIVLPRWATSQNAKILQIQNGGRPPHWKSSFGNISTSDYRINAKFCRIKQNDVLTQDTWPKYQILKIQDGGRPPFWKWFYRYNSAGKHPISAQFVCSRKLRFQGHSHCKVPQFCKFNMADGRHNENRFSAISRRFIVWLTRNFVQRCISKLRHRLRDQNIPVVDIWTAIIKQQIKM